MYFITTHGDKRRSFSVYYDKQGFYLIMTNTFMNPLMVKMAHIKWFNCTVICVYTATLMLQYVEE